MTAGSRGFLLLSSRLGIPERRPLTAVQLRFLAERIRAAEAPLMDGELDEAYLTSLGIGNKLAQRILTLLEDTRQVDDYLSAAARQGCHPITRADAAYPVLLRKRLGDESPGCLWGKGDFSLLDSPAVALVGSRDLSPNNAEFARRAGRCAAEQGYTLISGNARGADQTAQEACLAAGGSVISIIADQLHRQKERERVLYLSEDGFAEEFSVLRALQRNRIIHAMGWLTLVAQCTMGRGGTWDGTVKNLRYGRSPVFCYQDYSSAAAELEQMGAALIEPDDLQDLSGLLMSQNSLFDMM